MKNQKCPIQGASVQLSPSNAEQVKVLHFEVVEYVGYYSCECLVCNQKFTVTEDPSYHFPTRTWPSNCLSDESE